MKKWTLVELNKLPTLCVGQTDDLKLQSVTMRLWLARTSVADGEPYNNRVSVERYQNGRWQTVEEYQAR